MIAASHILQFLALAVLSLSAMAFWLGRRRAVPAHFHGQTFHSPAGYYGWYAFNYTFLPALGFCVAATLLRLLGLASIPAPMLAAGALALAAGGLTIALRNIHPELRARNAVERVIHALLVLASVLSILVTLGIVLSVVYEASVFFSRVSIWSFLTGTVWDPGSAFLEGAGRTDVQAGHAEFGALPLFAGTFLITLISMLVALPTGLLAAIYMSEYATQRMRRIAKPALEILAGIPTVVYGFFAAITVAPLIVRAASAVGLEATFNNALAPGLVMGVMIIPLVSSLSDDVLNAVPGAMREGSYALGATTSETICRVLLPAALPGVVAAFVLAFSRAVGETMIVVMAAGLRANLTANPLDSVTTVTVHIVDSLTGDQAFDSLQTLSAFGLGLVLLVVTFLLNILSAYIIRRFRQRYE